MTQTLPHRVDGVAGFEALVGVELGPSEAVAIDQARVNAFADATGDHQWIHVDAERATKESPWGGPIAHGYLVLSMVPVLMFEKLLDVVNLKMTINYGIGKLRFPAVTPVGSSLRLTATLESLVDRGPGKLGTFTTVFKADGADKPSCVAELLLMFG